MFVNHIMSSCARCQVWVTISAFMELFKMLCSLAACCVGPPRRSQSIIKKPFGRFKCEAVVIKLARVAKIEPQGL